MKRDSLWKRLKKIWANPEEMKAPLGDRAAFCLRYQKTPVGTLELTDGCWIFSYTDDFRMHPEPRTITEFPDATKVYKSQELWPFFQMRIPSLKQRSVREIIKREQIAEIDEVQLLRRFGQRTVANPFELIPCAPKPDDTQSQHASLIMGTRYQNVAAG